MDHAMVAEDISKIYEETDSVLKFITTSGVRIKMMASLLAGPKTSTVLKDELGVGASTVIHSARDMEKEKLLVENTDGYNLTSMGKIVTLKLLDLIKLLSVVKEVDDFWFSHNIEGIPHEFIKRMGELGKLKIVKSSPTNLLQVLSIYLKLMSHTQELRGVSPFFVPDLSKVIKKIILKGGKVYLVISEEILDPVMKSYKKDLNDETLRKVREGNLKIWVLDNVRSSLIVTESFTSLGLFNNNGTYDFSQDILSYDSGAINWGRDLFEYYKSGAKELKLE